VSFAEFTVVLLSREEPGSSVV